MTTRPEGWSVDRKIPVATMVMFAVYAVSIVWWGAKMDARQ